MIINNNNSNKRWRKTETKSRVIKCMNNVDELERQIHKHKQRRMKKKRRGRVPFAYRKRAEQSETSQRNNCFINFNFMVSDLAVEITTIDLMPRFALFFASSSLYCPLSFRSFGLFVYVCVYMFVCVSARSICLVYLVWSRSAMLTTRD